MNKLRKDDTPRRFPRIRVGLDGRVTAHTDWPVGIVDLSLGGCLLQCPSALDGGVIIDIKINIPGQSLALKGRVVHSSLDGMSLDTHRYLVGLEFMTLPAREEQDLRLYLDAVGRRRVREA